MLFLLEHGLLRFGARKNVFTSTAPAEQQESEQKDWFHGLSNECEDFGVGLIAESL